MSAPQLATLQLSTAALPIAAASGSAPAEGSPFARLLEAQLAQLGQAPGTDTPADALLAALEGESATGSGEALASLLASLTAMMKVSPVETASSEPAETAPALSDALASLLALLAATMKGESAAPMPAEPPEAEDRTPLLPATLIHPAVVPVPSSMASRETGSLNATLSSVPTSALAGPTLASHGLLGANEVATLTGRAQEALLGQDTPDTAMGPSNAASAAAEAEFSAVLSRLARSGADAATPNTVSNVSNAPVASAEASSLPTAAPPSPLPGRHEVHAPEARLTQPVGTPAWSSELGQRVLLMAQRQEGRAELVLTPPHLGRIEISLQVNHDQANALFTSANPAVREALEAALPRLREVLLDAGIQLGQAQVGADPRSSQQQPGENRDNRSTGEPAFGEQSLTARPLAAEPGVLLRRGLVDTFV